MQLHLHPELLDRVAASYALGTLRGPARRRFEALAREHAAVRSAALLWQGRIASINELQPGMAPPPAVWTRISNLVQAERADAAMQLARSAGGNGSSRAGWSAWLGNLALWRATSAAGALAPVLAIVVGLDMRTELGTEVARLQTQLQAAPQLGYVAVLADDKSAASMLVTFDRSSRQLTLQRVGAYQEADDRSLQLWALPPGSAPVSLGVLGRDKLLRLTADERNMRDIPALAISLEPKGGVPGAGGPTGPILFKGTLIRTQV